jgi:hypothetical protein
MAGLAEYSQGLRAIGQALEARNIQAFEIEPSGDELIVREIVPAMAQPGVSGAAPANTASAPVEQNRRIELRYSLHAIDLLEDAGRRRRGASGKPTDASSRSQILRCIGGYLEQKYARLLKISRAHEVVAVEYETSLGSLMKETFGVGDLYDLWVRMYLQRQGRTSDQ